MPGHYWVCPAPYWLSFSIAFFLQHTPAPDCTVSSVVLWILLTVWTQCEPNPVNWLVCSLPEVAMSFGRSDVHFFFYLYIAVLSPGVQPGMSPGRLWVCPFQPVERPLLACFSFVADLVFIKILSISELVCSASGSSKHNIHTFVGLIKIHCQSWVLQERAS